MQFKLNSLIFRLPGGLKDKYDIPVNQGIFDNDGTSDRLIFKVAPEDYNAANPISLDTKQGYAAPFTSLATELYQIEATDTDRRGTIKRYVLRDLIQAGGNLFLYGVTVAYEDCDRPLIAIEDYHELDTYDDELQGYTLRVGVLNVESLKGSYREKGTLRNYNKGCRIIFTHTHAIDNSQLTPYIYNG